MVLENKVTVDNSGMVVPVSPPSLALTMPVAPPRSPTKADMELALAPNGGGMAAFDPQVFRLSGTIRDSIFRQIQQFRWSDRQQHGRISYDTMYKHPAVSSVFDTMVSFVKADRLIFKPSGQNPTELQKELAAFANEQLRRLGASGDSRQGYEKLIEWFAQGWKYGFSIAEMETERAPWRGQSRIQIRRILPLPQSSLDHGFQPLEEFGQGILSIFDVRPKCIVQDMRGNILSVSQFVTRGTQSQIDWTGGDLLRLLIYTHGGGEGNPYGQSMFFSAFYAWAALYTIEQMEEAFLDASLPYLTISYKTPDGRPSPEYHAQVLKLLAQQDPALRALIGPDTTFSSVAPSNPSFTEHAKLKKMELRSYIQDCIFGVPAPTGNTTNAIDARNTIQVFFKYLMPALRQEIETLLTWQFARRLIDANWSQGKVGDEDYPMAVATGTLDNDLRISTPLLQQILQFVQADRMGEFLERTVPGFDGNLIATKPSETFGAVFGPANPAGSTGTPPTKHSGTPDTQHTGDTGNLGGSTDTAV